MGRPNVRIRCTVSCMAEVDIWSDHLSRGHRDPDDPDVVTVAFAVKEGVTIERVDLMEGTMIVIRARVPKDLQP